MISSSRADRCNTGDFAALTEIWVAVVSVLQSNPTQLPRNVYDVHISAAIVLVGRVRIGPIKVCDARAGVRLSGRT